MLRPGIGRSVSYILGDSFILRPEAVRGPGS